MAKKDTNFNQLLLEKGERFGLAIAVGLGVLLLVTSLFWPGSGLLATSPSANAKVLVDQARTIETGLQSARPGPQDKPPEIVGAMPTFTENKVDDPNKLLVAPLAPPAAEVTSSRREPELLTPNEGKVAIIMGQVKRYIFQYDKDGRPTHVEILKDAVNKDSKAGQGAANDITNYRNMMQKNSGRGGQAPGFGNNPAFGQPSNQNLRPDDGARKEHATQWVSIEKLGDIPGAKLAETVQPLRMAEIVASFPYQAEMDEFKDKLRLPSYSAVQLEQSLEVDEDKQPLAAFRFLGVRIQRRTVDAQGDPVDAQGRPLPAKEGDKATVGWQDIDLESTYKPYVILAGRRTQPDEQDLEVFTNIDGLMMPRLLLAQDAYPKIEKDLKNIKNALDVLAKANPEQVLQTASPFSNDSKLNVFSSKPSGSEQGNKGPMSPNGPMPRPGRPMSPMPPRPDQPGTAGAEVVPPPHALIRLLDVTIKPGTIYQYRLQARMANPNYKRTDVASPKYAEDLELTTKNWFVVPQNVVVPPEQVYYAVDQKELDGGPRQYKGINGYVPFQKDHQVAFQIHHWLDSVTADRRPTFVGEWSVAERLIVNRGEYIGRKLKVEVPVWVESMDGFVMAHSGNPKQKTSGIEVNFAHGSNEAILVDFEGPGQTYQRAGGPAVKEDEKPSEKTTTEVLILTHDGKLVARNSVSDAANQERKDRLDAWRKRIQEVKDQKPTGTQPIGNPFGGK